MKEILAQKMLDDKLDFLSLEDSLALHNSVEVYESRFWWVARSEELENNGFDMSAEEVIKECLEIYGDSDYGITIGDRHEQFDEFTLELFPAPTYIDLIRIR